MVKLENEIKDIIRLLKIIRGYVGIKDCDVTMSTFNTSKDVINAIDNHITRLSESDISKINELKILFLPTSDFQEISISNGWGEEYLEIAEEFDSLVQLVKKRIK